MSFIDVGKDAKRKGALHPKHAPVPEDRATPASHDKHKPEKPFGYRCDRRFLGGRWVEYRRWFKSEASRDQAYEKEAAHQEKFSGPGILEYRNLRKVSRP